MQTLRTASAKRIRPINSLDLNHYRSPTLRALAWSCFSTPLLQASAGLSEAPPLPLTPARRHWLNELDRDDRALREHLQRRCASPRLGLVFESLWHFFLEQDPHTELLAHNLPVRQNGQTLGEFDIIYRDLNSGAAIHLELAVKFFLATGAGKLPLSAWRGPNSADRLDRKLERLNRHQLQLSLSEAGRQTLHNLGIDHCQRRLRIAGILFYADSQAAETPGLHPLHCRGHWLRASALAQQWQSQGSQFDWRLLEKPRWLSADYERALPINDATIQRAQQRPLMLINPSLDRCFVVPDQWPKPVKP